MFTPQGIIPALVTPLTREGELMEDGLRNLLDYVIAGGVHGVFVLGSSGEIYGLDDAQKRRVLEVTTEHVNGRVAVYAGASEITTRDCVKTAKLAAEVGGVDALSVLTPYFMTPTQAELVEHYRTIAAATDLPLVLYNNPGRTKVPITVASAVQLAMVDTIVGIKDSSGDFTLSTDYIRETPDDFAVLLGRDTLIYAGLCHGASGAIASTGNIVPKLIVGIYDAFQAGDTAEALRLQSELTPLRNLVDVATFPVVLKEGLRAAGIDAGYCLAPARDLDERYRAELATVVANLI
ncbi:MAG: dihydrodipicolinate synthase family protein [Micropruina sp.]|nr:dihydrodipicolinate synthase family protein [Micropruina sp.]